MIFALFIIILSYLLFIAVRKLLFYKKRNYSSLYFKSFIMYFNDYFYYYQIKNKIKRKEFFIVSSINNNTKLNAILAENEMYHFPDESLFSALFLEKRSFIILQSKNLLDEKNQYDENIKKRFLRLFRRLRNNIDFYNLKGIISIKDQNDSNEDINRQIIHEFFITSELFGIYNAHIPYYSLANIDFSEDLYDVIPDFLAKKGTDVIGFQDTLIDSFENTSLKKSNYLLYDFQNSIDHKKFNMLQLNLSESDLRKYLSISSILKNKLNQLNKNYNESLEDKLEKFNLQLNSRGIFFFGGDQIYSLEKSLQALAQYPLEGIKLSKEKFTFYKYAIFSVAIITCIITFLILGGFIKSVTHYLADFKSMKANMYKMQTLTSSIDNLPSSITSARTCETIENAYKFGEMSQSYYFIPNSWLQKFPEPLLHEYSKHFSVFLNKHLIKDFNEFTERTLILNQSDMLKSESHFSFVKIEELINILKKLNSIYTLLNKKSPESFKNSLSQMLSILNDNQQISEKCTLPSFNSSTKFTILYDKNFKIDLALSYNEFLTKEKAKLDNAFDELLENQFNKININNLVKNFNNASLELFSIDYSSFSYLSDQEKKVKINNLVNSYEKLIEFVNLSNELFKMQGENNPNSINYLIFSYFKKSGLVSDQDNDKYKEKLSAAFKDYQSLLARQENPIFKQNIFSFELNNTVHLNKDISFYLTHLSKSYRSMQTIDEQKMSRSMQAQNLFLNTNFIQDTYYKVLNLDSVINNFSERNYPLAFSQKLRDTLKYVIEMDIVANKNNLLTEIPDSNLNILANGEEELHLNLLNSYKALKPLDALLKKNNLNKIAAVIYPIVYTKINFHLENNMNKFYNLGLYSSNKHNFNSWNGNSSPAQFYYSQQSESDLSSYLERQKSLIEKFYSENMESLVQIHSVLNSTYKDTSYHSTNMFWQDIKSEIIDKARKGSVTSLNDFIFNTMDKINTSNCYLFLKSFQKINKEESEYFATIKYDIGSKLAQKCERLFSIKSITEYNSLAKIFNNTLAGKFPFAQYKNSKMIAHFAPPEDVINFNQKYALFITDIYPFLKEYHPSILNVEMKEFLSKMSNVHNFITANKDKDGQIKYPVDLEFRANRPNEINGNRVISWKLETANQKYGSNYGTPEKTLLNWKVGDPLKMAFRISKSKKSNIVGREIQDITVDEKNPWGLLSFISQYKDCEKICNPNLIKLNFATNTGDNEIVVYFKFKILKMNSFYESVLIPDFPYFAPEINESLNANADRTVSLVN